MLTDSVLESIIRNKVPVRLQEIKEITVGSVQELLQKLLLVESVVQEWNRWLNKKRDSTSAPRRSRAPVKNCEEHVVSTSDENKGLIRVQAEQWKDGALSQIINYLDGRGLPEDAYAVKKIIVIATN